MTRSIGSLFGRLGAAALLAVAAAACDGSSSGPDGQNGEQNVCSVDQTSPVASTRTPGMASLSLGPVALGAVPDRFTSELAVGTRYAYTGTTSSRGGRRGNVLNVWDTQSGTPTLVRGVTIGPDTITTLGDVQVSDDGRHLFVATEPVGSLRIFSLDDPADPRLISVFRPTGTTAGVHTAQISRVNGVPHAFLSLNPTGTPAKLVIVDLSDHANPTEVLVQQMGRPFIHDVFVRDGLLFTALWDEGLVIWDIGACGRGGVRAPVRLSAIETSGGNVHNVWWYHAANGNRKYAFVGEEGAGSVVGATSSGDIHVVDVTDPLDPREVAFYHQEEAGTHNFSMDESRGLLFAAYYNGGVVALDVRGDLGACAANHRDRAGRCDLSLMGREVARWLADPADGAYIWGVEWVGSRNELYASDMLKGLYRLDTSGLPR